MGWWPADTRVLYSALLAVVGAQRLLELWLSRRHRQALLARGGVERGASHYPAMVAVHAAFLPSCALEVWGLERPLVLPLAVASCLALAAATLLRCWSISTLGERWCTRVVVVPGEPLVRAGPYRFLRHPNYLAVALEMAAVPLLHGAWLSAVAFSLANGLVLRVRVRVEEGALGLRPRRERGTP